jgi:hypothetical protein
MIPVLLSSAAIARGDLQVTVFVGTDPHVSPCRWNHKRAKTLQQGRVTNDVAVGVSVYESPAMTLSANARHSIGDIAQPCRFGRSDVFLRDGLSQLDPPRSFDAMSHASSVEEKRGVGYGRYKLSRATPWNASAKLSQPIEGLHSGVSRGPPGSRR